MSYNPYQTNQSISGAITAPPGSIMAVTGTVTTATGNSSVMLLAGTNILGSVAVLQGTTPWLISSIYGNISGSVAAVVTNTVTGVSPAGSITAVTMPAGSVLTAFVTAGSVISTAPAGSVMAVTATQGTTPWLIGSIYGNISGSVVAIVTNTVTTTAPAGSVIAVSGDMGSSIIAVGINNQADGGSSQQQLNVSGFNRVFNGANWDRTRGNSSIGTLVSTAASSVITVSLAGSVMSVSATAPAGSVMTVATLAGSIMTIAGATTTTAGSIMSVATPAGSVMAVRTDNASVITTQLAGSIMAVNATVTVTSVMLLNSTAVIGSVSALQGTNPWTIVHPAASITSVTNPAGSITAVSATALAGSIISVAMVAGSIAAVSATAPAGSVMATNQVAGSIMSVSATQPAASIMSVTNPGGSVTGVRTDNASIIATFQNSSLFSAQQGTWRVSVAGGYTAGAASVVNAVGFLNFGVRNDALASTLAADAQYQPLVVGPVGEMIVANSPISKWVRGTASIMTSAGGSVLVITAPAAGVFTYLTGVQYGGFGPQSVLLTISGGLGSVLGQYAIPAGGSQVVGFLPNAIKSGPGTAVTASIGGAGATTSSVYIGLQGFSSNT